MPSFAYAMGRLFQLDAEMMTGVVMVGCVPGAMASNVLTLAARGNVSYSVSLTTAASIDAVPIVGGCVQAKLSGLSMSDPRFRSSCFV